MSENRPPAAARQAKKLTTFGDVRDDFYYWMRLSDEQKNAKNPDAETRQVLDFLEAENSYTQAKMQHTDKLQQQLLSMMNLPNFQN